MNRLSSHWHLLHPYTSLAVAGITALLAGAAVAGAHTDAPGAGLAIRSGLAMLLIQFSIGASNDIFDRPFDALAKPGKPLPSGQVRLSMAWTIWSLLIGGAVILAWPFGLLALAVMLFGLGCGLAYNAGLKRTPLSWLPHALAAPTILTWVWVIAGQPLQPLLWVYPLGLLLGPALNIANQLAGAEAAEASGERSLVHSLGVIRAQRLAAGLFLLAAVLMPFVAGRVAGAPVAGAAVAGAAAAGEAGQGLPWAIAGSALAVIFLVLAERGSRRVLWPLALTIGGLLAVGFQLSLK